VLAIFALGGALVSVGIGVLDRREHAVRTAGMATAAEIRVEVLNGEGREGSAADIAADLRMAGYNVVRTAAADRTDYHGLLVLARTAGPVAMVRAQTVGDCLHTSAVLLQRQDAPTADVTVIVGR
jgi:hypothetical protein